jgi:hypothetical protein
MSAQQFFQRDLQAAHIEQCGAGIGINDKPESNTTGGEYTRIGYTKSLERS